jgi:uncharacterized membrane protein (UPF0136 family)
MGTIPQGQVVLGIYGILLIAGGMMGFVKTRSRISLFAGAITGGALCGSYVAEPG